MREQTLESQRFAVELAKLRAAVVAACECSEALHTGELSSGLQDLVRSILSEGHELKRKAATQRSVNRILAYAGVPTSNNLAWLVTWCEPEVVAKDYEAEVAG